MMVLMMLVVIDIPLANFFFGLMFWLWEKEGGEKSASGCMWVYVDLDGLNRWIMGEFSPVRTSIRVATTKKFPKYSKKRNKSRKKIKHIKLSQMALYHCVSFCVYITYENKECHHQVLLVQNKNIFPHQSLNYYKVFY